MDVVDVVDVVVVVVVAGDVVAAHGVGAAGAVADDGACPRSSGVAASTGTDMEGTRTRTHTRTDPDPSMIPTNVAVDQLPKIVVALNSQKS